MPYAAVGLLWYEIVRACAQCYLRVCGQRARRAALAANSHFLFCRDELEIVATACDRYVSLLAGRSI